MSLRYLSVCSGIEAASVAWGPLGWTPVGFAEIDKAASRVLAHRFGSNMPGEPLARNGVPNHGDFTAIDPATLGPVDLLVGGTPCQAFSVAGQRRSLADARGNLTLAYVGLAHDLARSHGLRWAVWENVPGVLNTRDNAFGSFLGALAGHDRAIPAPRGGKWTDAGLVDGPWARAAWCILDAQYFGLAQRRRRVYVVVGFGDGPDPAQVLFEPQGVRRDSPPRGGARQDLAPTLSARTRGGGGLGTDAECDGGLIVAPPLTGNPYGDHASREGLPIAHSLRGEGFDAREDGTGRGIPVIPVYAPNVAATLTRGVESAGKGGAAGRRQEDDPDLIAFDCKAGGETGFAIGHVAGALRGEGNGGGHAAVASQTGVRRLTPVECHRLQGFPGDWAAIPGASDNAQYKQLGNSMAVAVMAWIGRRIAAREGGS